MVGDTGPKSVVGTTVYSCTFSSYDFNFGPFVHTPSARMLRFTDARRPRGNWELRPIPEEAALQPSHTLVNRYMKMFPRRFFPDSDVAVYVDGNILIKSDLTPLLDEFKASGADLALFRHPHGRTLDEEIEFALIHRVEPQQRELASAQRARYRDLGLLDSRVSENSIIFYRVSRDIVDELSALWWQETTAYAHRDQFSLPYVLSVVPVRVHYWSWHFKATPNPYFDQYPHRYGSRHNQRRLAAEFLGKYRFHQRVLSYAIHPPKIVESISKRLRPARGQS
jgi:Protein of unknown function (DUF616)